jgi:cellulose synthase/poly-beta-1,6-N-acetylglucosamine synthase-like glycosyltransferase
MHETNRVSIIIPVKPGRRVDALTHLRRVEYPESSVEVLVAEGFQPSRQRNLAAASSSGEILYFLDDDSKVSPDFLARGVLHYRDPQVAVVGGPSLTPDSDGILQHSFAMVFNSVFGGGGMRNRYRRSGFVRSTGDHELILCNLSFRRDIFLAADGFHEGLYPNEENELLERIVREGWRLIHDPDLFIYRSQRSTLRAFSRQLFGYGRGRGEQTVISGRIRPITLVPALFALYLLGLPFANNPVYYIPLLCYLITVAMVAVMAALRHGRSLSALLLPLVFPLFHICYGLGFIWGVMPKVPKSPWEKGTITIHHVKKFEEGWETAITDHNQSEGG